MSDHSVLRNKRSIEMISTLVRMGHDSVGLGKLWTTIHQHYGVGEISGSKLLLSPADRQALRNLLIDKAKWDPLEPSTLLASSGIGRASGREREVRLD